MRNAECPSFTWKTVGSRPSAASARTPPTPRSSSWRIRCSRSPEYSASVTQVDVEQVERHGGRRPCPDVVAPHVRGHRLAREVDLDGHRLALQAECLRVDRRVGLGLAALVAQPLGEVPTAVEQSDPDQGQPELGRGFQVVAREDAEATRVDRQAHVDAELHAEVGDEHVVVLVGL